MTPGSMTSRTSAMSTRTIAMTAPTAETNPETSATCRLSAATHWAMTAITFSTSSMQKPTAMTTPLRSATGSPRAVPDTSARDRSIHNSHRWPPPIARTAVMTEHAQQDRCASAAERDAARLDRSTSSTDRTAALDDRTQSGHDRNTAQVSRSNAAVDRGIATFDDLTGAYRRGPGLVELEREMARSHRTGEPLTLVFVDVDGLKAVNDSLGHGAGDAVLVDVANTLAAHLRPYDVIVRFGGDEFLCLCQGLVETDADTRLALVNSELAHSGRSISVGVANLRAHDTAASFTTRADQALYRRREEQRARADEQTTQSGDP